MSKKGFTLVELIAVVTILSIIIIIAIPSINTNLRGTKDKLDEINKKNLEDAGKTLANEAIYCEISDKAQSIFGNSDCNVVKKNLIENGGYTISVDTLREKEFFVDSGNHCSGDILITADENYKVTVTPIDVKCVK